MRNSRIPNFYDFTILQRLDILRENGFLKQEDIKTLLSGHFDLNESDANKMIENVISTFSMPLGLSLNLQVNEKDYVVPLVVEEPSIVAALSASSKVIRNAGGIRAESTRPILIGQILLVESEHPTNAKESILLKKSEILALANYLQPNMFARGGGAIDLEVKIHPATSRFGDLIVVHIFVDTKDAMGANLVNSMCEGIAPLLEKISGARSFLRILSNLHDRSIATAECRIPPDLLKTKNSSGEEIIEGIILANHFAAIDPYRAATHNKGIMNGIDPLAIATGNDWRAIEAGVHAYAARGENYTSLTNWFKDPDNNLIGRIKIPLKVGIVGAPVQSNPKIKLVHKILGINSSNELMELMASVGLAQNFAALKALVTEGIQRGHMSLHARSVARAADVPEVYFENVVDELIKSGEIKVWKAKEILSNMSSQSEEIKSQKQISENELHSGFGKVILFGEHAVVYGSNAIAAPIPFAIKSKVEKSSGGSNVVIARWGMEFNLFGRSKEKNSLISALELILQKMNMQNENLQILVFPYIPRAMGLGGSAALSVSVIRALSAYSNSNLTDDAINEIAFEAEKVVHGTPSGIDNTMATYGKLIRYKKDEEPKTFPIEKSKQIPLLIGLSGHEGLTLNMVRKVREGWSKNQNLYNSIFGQINEITLQAIESIKSYDLEKLGYLMNLNQGLLNAIQVSTPELEEMCAITRRNGAMGAKLTGGGGGGAMICLCPENRTGISDALNNLGYQTILTDI